MRSAVLVLVSGAVLLAGCATGTQATPDWKPKPSFSGEGYQPPANPQPVQPVPPQSGSRSRTPSTSPQRQRDGAVVATHLTAPTGLTIMPDNTALVGERTTGRIVRVQPQPGHPVQTVRTLTGLSTSGGGGLLDLAISPNYREDNLIFAYITTAKDNRVVAFTLRGPVTPVLTGIPRGPSDNTGRITFAADGNLLVGTGSAGQKAAVTRGRSSLAGKVLRVTDIGRAAHGDPYRRSPVFATGLTRTDGLCTATDSMLTLQTESVPGAPADPVYQVQPAARFSGTGAAQPLTELPVTARAPGGCALLHNELFLTSLDGHELLATRVASTASGNLTTGKWATMLHDKYGRLRTVVAAPDGALWLTTSNKDGHGRPVPSDERVLRIVPAGGSGDNPL